MAVAKVQNFHFMYYFFACELRLKAAAELKKKLQY